MTVQTNASQTQPIDCQIDFLSRQVAAAEEARRHAQAVSSELVNQKRALEQKLTIDHAANLTDNQWEGYGQAIMMVQP